MLYSDVRCKHNSATEAWATQLSNPTKTTDLLCQQDGINNRTAEARLCLTIVQHSCMARVDTVSLPSI